VTKGSHRTVPGQIGKGVPLGALRAVLRSAGLEEKKVD
jgi:predicted RNA binding protein YcfA (HicA-like mRNA interferase family)